LDPLARRQSSSGALLGVPCLTAAHQRHAVQFVESIHSEPFLARSRYDFLTIDLTPRFGCVDPTAIRAAPLGEGVRIATCTANYQPVGLLHLQSSVQLNRTMGSRTGLLFSVVRHAWLRLFRRPRAQGLLSPRRYFCQTLLQRLEQIDDLRTWNFTYRRHFLPGDLLVDGRTNPVRVLVYILGSVEGGRGQLIDQLDGQFTLDVPEHSRSARIDLVKRPNFVG